MGARRKTGSLDALTGNRHTLAKRWMGIRRKESNMKYIEAPTVYHPGQGDLSVFLAGGITGCPDWQQEMRHLLKKTKLVLLNPRRANFPMDDPDAAYHQIRWEHHMLRRARAILFWFPCETICPIVLYELGAWSMSDKQIFIGAHPEYTRLQDVRIQTHLARPEVRIAADLEALAGQVIRWSERT